MFACIFIPDFSSEAIVRFEPELRHRALVVLAGRSPLERAVGMNENARQLGVEVGAMKAQLVAYEDLVLRARSESRESSAHAALLDCAQAFSPEVEDNAADAVLLNLEGLEPLFGPPSKVIHQVADRTWQMGLKVNVAAAGNPDAAFLAAHGFSGTTFISEGYEAKKLGGLPVDALFESFSADEEQGTRWLETFDRWGVRNLRSLAALPEIPVSERLGQEGIRLQRLARGEVTRTLRLYEPQPIFEESLELEYPIVLLEPLAFLLNRMLEQVCARLDARALAAQELKLTLELMQGIEGEEQGLKRFSSETDSASPSTRYARSGQALKGRSSTEDEKSSLNDNFHEKFIEDKGKESCIFTRTLKLPVPMLNAKTFLKLLQLDLQAHPPGAPIVKIHLSAEPARARAGQSGLFQPVFPEPEKLELTLARIAGIVGEGRVGSAELLDTHREGAFEMRHFAPTEPDKVVGGQWLVVSENHLSGRHPSASPRAGCDTENGCPEPKSLATDHSPVTAEAADIEAQEKMSAVIALRMFRPPLRAVVNVSEGKPVRLKCADREEIGGDIVWTAGPWRSSGDWSEQEGWSREEWDVAVPVESGIALYRLVEDRLGRNWFVEGAYD